MITNKNETKKITKHLLCKCKFKSNSTTGNLNQNGNNKTC